MEKPLYANLLAKKMKELGITDEELARKSSLSESTIKYFKSNPQWNISLDSLIKILIPMESTFNELIKIPNNIEDFIELFCDDFETEQHKSPNFNKIHYFTIGNNRLLQRLFIQAGFPVSIEPYNSFKRINLMTEQTGVPIVLKFNFQIHQGQKSYIKIQDSFIGVNTYYYELENIIEACVDVIEKFTTKIDVNKLQIINYEGDSISPDLEQQTATKIRNQLKHDYELTNEFKSVSFIPPQILERRGYQISKSILGTLSFEKPLKS